MAELTPGSYLQEACTTAQGDRQVLSALVCTQGRAPGYAGELASTPGAGLSVDVADGNAFVEGTESGWQGMYMGSNDATVNVPLDAADPTDDRIDLIIMQFRDSVYSGANDDFVITKVTGTPSPSPVAPATPDNSLILATVLVENGDTTVDAANITPGDFYVMCPDVAKPFAFLGSATTGVTIGANNIFAEWDGSNILTPEFTLQAGVSGPNQVLKYTGQSRWFIAYGFATFDADGETFNSMRIIHYNPTPADLGDTHGHEEYEDVDLVTIREKTIPSTVLLYLSTDEYVAMFINSGSSPSSPVDVTHQMRIAAL